MVLIFDTFEQISSETRNWLDEWLFEHLFDRFPNLVVVIAGRPDIHEYVKNLTTLEVNYARPRDFQHARRDGYSRLSGEE